MLQLQLSWSKQIRFDRFLFAEGTEQLYSLLVAGVNATRCEPNK